MDDSIQRNTLQDQSREDHHHLNKTDACENHNNIYLPKTANLIIKKFKKQRISAFNDQVDKLAKEIEEDDDDIVRFESAPKQEDEKENN